MCVHQKWHCVNPGKGASPEIFTSVECPQLTSRPCRSTRKVDLGPRPHNVYNCGVSSLAKSAIWKYTRRGWFLLQNLLIAALIFVVSFTPWGLSKMADNLYTTISKAFSYRMSLWFGSWLGDEWGYKPELESIIDDPDIWRHILSLGFREFTRPQRYTSLHGNVNCVLLRKWLLWVQTIIPSYSSSA